MCTYFICKPKVVKSTDVFIRKMLAVTEFKKKKNSKAKIYTHQWCIGQNPNHDNYVPYPRFTHYMFSNSRFNGYALWN